MLESFYAKEVRTRDSKIRYFNCEVELNNIPEHIQLIIPDAIKLSGEGFIEYVSTSSIEAIEVFEDKGRYK